MKEQKRLPDHVYLVGGGRQARTRRLRRANRFSERVFRIGEDIVIRPGRCLQLSLVHVARYVDQVIRHIERGALIVRYDGDRFVTPDELRALLQAKGFLQGGAPPSTEGSPSVNPGPISTNPPELLPENEEEEVLDDEGDIEGGDEVLEPPASPASEAPGASGAPGSEAEAPPVEAAPSCEENSEAKKEPEKPVAAPSLPENWQKSSKKDLQVHATRLGVAFDENTSNKNLVKAIEAALKK